MFFYQYLKQLSLICLGYVVMKLYMYCKLHTFIPMHHATIFSNKNFRATSLSLHDK